VSNDGNGVQLDASYPDRYIECRTSRHSWRTVGYYYQAGEVIRVSHCSGCNGDAYDHWSRSGFRLRARTYSMADDYYFGGGGVTLQEVRHEALNRATVYNSMTEFEEAIFRGQPNRAKAAH